MKAEIVATGSELVLGETIDTNSAYLARNLAAMGITVLRTTCVGDGQEPIRAAVDEALDRADLVICTGGLGPTVDDRTREAVAEAVGQPLVFHQHLLDQIAARFQSFGRTMSPSNRQQAYVPAGARIVENPRGTAPAFIVESERGTIVVLPGVPSEMRYLWENAIAPYLRDERGETGVILVHTLHATGAGESVIGEQIADLMDQENPNVGISAKRGQYEIRIVAQSNSRDGAVALAEECANIIRQRIGQYIIGTETLQQQVVRQLGERGLSIALADGNERAPAYRVLSEQPAGRALLRGVEIIPPQQPLDDAAAIAQAKAHALRVRERWGTDLGIGVQAATAPGADNFTTIAVAIAHADGVQESHRRYDLNLDDGWDVVGTQTLDALRQLLQAS